MLQLVVSLLMLSLVACNHERIVQLEKQNKELSAKLDAAAQKASLENQERCAKQALAVFREQRWGANASPGFVNHYNIALNRCFILMHSMYVSANNELGTLNALVDAFEGQGYGDYYSRVNRPPNVCYVIVSGKQVNCSSPDEFDSLIKM